MPSVMGPASFVVVANRLLRTIDLDALPGAFDDFVKGRVKGRTVVRMAG